MTETIRWSTRTPAFWIDSHTAPSSILTRGTSRRPRTGREMGPKIIRGSTPARRRPRGAVAPARRTQRNPQPRTRGARRSQRQRGTSTRSRVPRGSRGIRRRIRRGFLPSLERFMEDIGDNITIYHHDQASPSPEEELPGPSLAYDGEASSSSSDEINVVKLEEQDEPSTSQTRGEDTTGQPGPSREGPSYHGRWSPRRDIWYEANAAINRWKCRMIRWERRRQRARSRNLTYQETARQSQAEAASASEPQTESREGSQEDDEISVDVADEDEAAGAQRIRHIGTTYNRRATCIGRLARSPNNFKWIGAGLPPSVLRLVVASHPSRRAQVVGQSAHRMLRNRYPVWAVEPKYVITWLREYDVKRWKYSRLHLTKFCKTHVLARNLIETPHEELKGTVMKLARILGSGLREKDVKKVNRVTESQVVLTLGESRRAAELVAQCRGLCVPNKQLGGTFGTVWFEQITKPMAVSFVVAGSRMFLRLLIASQRRGFPSRSEIPVQDYSTSDDSSDAETTSDDSSYDSSDLSGFSEYLSS